MEGLRNGCKSGIIRCHKLAQFVNGSCLVECVKKELYVQDYAKRTQTNLVEFWILSNQKITDILGEVS